MESGDRPTQQSTEVVDAALESVCALENLLNALAERAVALERRLDEAEKRLEKVTESVGKQD